MQSNLSRWKCCCCNIYSNHLITLVNVRHNIRPLTCLSTYLPQPLSTAQCFISPHESDPCTSWHHDCVSVPQMHVTSPLHVLGWHITYNTHCFVHWKGLFSMSSWLLTSSSIFCFCMQPVCLLKRVIIRCDTPYLEDKHNELYVFLLSLGFFWCSCLVVLVAKMQSFIRICRFGNVDVLIRLITE